MEATDKIQLKDEKETKLMTRLKKLRLILQNINSLSVNSNALLTSKPSSRDLPSNL